MYTMSQKARYQIVWISLFLMVAASVTLITGTFVGFRTAAKAPISQAGLQRIYSSVNDEYFSGKLPKDTTVEWGDLSNEDSMGLTLHRPGGGNLIILDPNANRIRRVAILTELHEICHVATQDFEHGEKWQGCMLHLAEQGAFADLW